MFFVYTPEVNLILKKSRSTEGAEVFTVVFAASRNTTNKLDCIIYNMEI